MPPVAEVALEIDAPLARVWRIMVDLPNYAAWNPFIVRAECEGPLAVDAMLRLRVRWRDRGGARSDEVVTELTPPGVDRGATGPDGPAPERVGQLFEQNKLLSGPHPATPRHDRGCAT